MQRKPGNDTPALGERWAAQQNDWPLPAVLLTLFV